MNFQNTINDLKAHNEVMSEMQAVSMRHKIGALLIGEKLGATAWKGSIASSWITFLMPDNSIRFGSIGYPTSDAAVVVDVSEFPVYNGLGEKLGYSDASKETKSFFQVPDFNTEGNDRDWNMLASN